LQISYVEGTWVVIELNGSNVPVVIENGIIGVNDPTSTPYVISAEEVALNTTCESELFLIRGWPLSVGEGEKTVYLRFGLSDGTTYPETEAFHDSIILQNTLPSTPGKPRAINSANGSYVGEEILYTFRKSQDSISGIESYGLDVVEGAGVRYTESFESDILVPLDQGEADNYIANGDMCFSIKGDAQAWSYTRDIATNSLRLTSTQSATPDKYDGIEVSLINELASKSLFASIDYRFVGEAPATGEEEEMFVVIRSFPDKFLGGQDNTLLPLAITVDGTQTSNLLPISIEVVSGSTGYAIPLSIYVYEVDTTDTNTHFVDRSVINADIFLSDTDYRRDFAMLSIGRKSGLMTVHRSDWDLMYSLEEGSLEVTDFPDEGSLEVIYEEATDFNELRIFDDNLLTDPEATKHYIITQEFLPAIDMFNGDGYTIGALRIVTEGMVDTTSIDTISATIVECDINGIPVNVSRLTPTTWNDVDTAVGTIFTATHFSQLGRKTAVDLTTSDAVVFRAGKRYLIIVAIQADNNGESSVGLLTLAGERHNFGMRRNYITTSLHSGFYAATWAAGGMKIIAVDPVSTYKPYNPIALEIVSDTNVVLCSNYRQIDDAQLTVYWHDDATNYHKRLGSFRVAPLLHNYRSLTVGYRHKNLDANVNLYIDSIELSDRKVITDVTLTTPEDLNSTDLVVDQSVYDGTPTIGGIDDVWRQLIANRYSNPAAEHVLTLSQNNTLKEYVSGLNPSITNLQDKVGLFSSTVASMDTGGRADKAGTEDAWIGQDIYLTKPTGDTSAYIECNFSFDNAPDYDETELFFMVASDEVYSSTVDIYRNDYVGTKNPTDYIRLSITPDGQLRLYRNIDDNAADEEQFTSIYSIEDSINTILINLGYTGDYVWGSKGRIYIYLSNEENASFSTLNIEFLVYKNGTAIKARVLSQFIDSPITATSMVGLYVVIGTRVKNLTRDHSYLALNKLSISTDDATISVEDETDLVLYEELSGRTLSELTTLYPDLSNTANDGTYYDKDAWAYVRANEGTNCKYFVLGYDDDYTLTQQEINYCDQVLQNIDNVRCYGVIVSNAYDTRRSQGEPQRLVAASVSSGLTGRDSAPPTGDRRAYSGANSLSYAGANDSSINLFVNSRGFSQSQWICSEWQFYEAKTPWNANNEWFYGTYHSGSLRLSNPTITDTICATTKVVEMEYILNDEAKQGNLEVYFGVANFKPAYRTYNHGETERFLSTPVKDGDHYDTSIHDLEGVITGNKYAGNYDPDLVSTALCFGDGHLNSFLIDGNAGYNGPVIDEDTTLESYQYLLPYSRVNVTVTSLIDNIAPIASGSRKWFTLAIRNDGVVSVLYNNGAATIEDFEVISDVNLFVQRSGTFYIEIKQSVTSVTNSINADSKLYKTTETGTFDQITIYTGVGTSREKLVAVHCPSMASAGYFEYLHPHIGVREKYTTGTVQTSIADIKIASTKSSSITPEKPQSVAWWYKKDGAFEDDDTVYGRYMYVGQAENDEASIIVQNTKPHLAQSFTIPYEAEYLSDRCYGVPWVLDTLANSCRVSYIELKKPMTSGQRQTWRLLITGDSAGQPDLAVNSATTTTGNRPNTDIPIYNTTVYAVAYAIESPTSQYLRFVFEPPVYLSSGTKYWMVLTHPTISSSEADTVLGDVVKYQWGDSIDSIGISAAITSEYVSKNRIPDSQAMTWDVASNQWVAQNVNLWFKVFSDYYTNRANYVDGDQHMLRSLSNSYSGITGALSEDSSLYTADLEAPVGPVNNKPTIVADISTSVISRTKELAITAADTGSGLWRFRIGYTDDDNQITFSDWNTWITSSLVDAYEVCVYPWTYIGDFIGDLNVFAQIQDNAGNISETEAITVSMDYGFIVDTEPPYLSRIRIEGDARIDDEMVELDIVDKRYTNVSVYAVDATTGVKDMRINRDGEMDGEGNLIYSSWMPMTPNFIEDMGSDDGLKTRMVQVRDFANNADPATIQYLLTVECAKRQELPMQMKSFSSTGIDELFYTVLATIDRVDLTATSKSHPDYDAYQVYQLFDSNNILQDINDNETLSVYVNSVLQTENVDYTRSASENIIIFASSLTSSDVVVVDTFEQVCKLYRFNGVRSLLVYRFSDESETVCTAIEEYNGKLYLGFSSGAIYSYNGVKVVLETVLRQILVDGFGQIISITDVPVGALKSFKFTHEVREYLYAGGREIAMLWRYGGNSAVDALSWKEIYTYDTYCTSIYSLEDYNNTLYIGGGDLPYIMTYSRILDDDGVTENEAYSATDLRTIAPTTCGTIVTTLRTFGDSIFAGTNSAAIFMLQEGDVFVPAVGDWSDITSFSDAFLRASYPWRFWESPGHTDASKSDNISILPVTNSLGLISYNELVINADISIESVFLQDSDSDSVWVDTVDNTTGWAVEFECRRDSASDILGAQGVQIFDGAYQVSLSIEKDKLVLSNGETTETLNSGTIDTGERAENYVYEQEFTEIPTDIDLYNLEYVVEDGLYKLKVIEGIADKEVPYPFMEINGLEIYAGSTTELEFKVTAHGFEQDTTKLYFQWSVFEGGPYIKERTYSININNDNVPKSFKFNPGWNGIIRGVRLLIEPTENATLFFDYIRVKQVSKVRFNTQNTNKYRLTGKGQDVRLYLNDSQQPIFFGRTWLTIPSINKMLMFGKISQSARLSKYAWKNFKIYTLGDIDPRTTETTGWELMHRFSSGKAVNSLTVVRDKLIAVVNPLESIKSTDASEDLLPRSFIMENSDAVVWETQVDALLPSTTTATTAAAEWQDNLYVGAEDTNVVGYEIITDVDTKNFLQQMENKDVSIDVTNFGNIYCRRYTNAFDSIVKDTKAPETSVVIKELDSSGGIDVYELAVYITDSISTVTT